MRLGIRLATSSEVVVRVSNRKKSLYDQKEGVEREAPTAIYPENRDKATNLNVGMTVWLRWL